MVEGLKQAIETNFVRQKIVIPCRYTYLQIMTLIFINHFVTYNITYDWVINTINFGSNQKVNELLILRNSTWRNILVTNTMKYVHDLILKFDVVNSLKI